MRVANPKFIAVQIFGTIISDIFLTTAPLLPTFKGTIPITLIKPAATAVGVGIFCNIFFFPESTSHIVLSNIKQILSPMTEFVDACRISLDHHARPMKLEALRKAKAQGVAGFKALEGRLSFLPLDIAICRWNVDDIMLLKKPLRLVFITWAGLLEAQISRSESKDRISRLAKRNEAQQQGKPSLEQHKVGHHHITQQLDFAQLFRNTETEDLTAKSMAALQNAADPLLITCNDAIGAVIETLNVVNERKWYNRPTTDELSSMHRKHEQLLKDLRSECERFFTNTTPQILEPHSALFDEDGVLNPPSNLGAAPLRGVILGLIFEERITGFARALTQLLAQIVALEGERQWQRLWLPAGIRHFGSWVSGREPTPQVTPVMPELEQEQEKSKPRRHHRHGKKSATSGMANSELDVPTASDQLASIHIHRGKTRNSFGRFVLSVTHWISNTEGLFALRVVVATIALGVPAVIPSSAGFYYREKGLWALIMTQ